MRVGRRSHMLGDSLVTPRELKCDVEAIPSFLLNAMVLCKAAQFFFTDSNPIVMKSKSKAETFSDSSESIS